LNSIALKGILTRVPRGDDVLRFSPRSAGMRAVRQRLIINLAPSAA